MSHDTTSWYVVGPVDEVRGRAPWTVDVDGLEIAVFAVSDGFRALGNSCPHAGGPLAEGVVEHGCVECPWHGWSFDLTTGACRNGPGRAAEVFAIREREGILEVAVPKR